MPEIKKIVLDLGGKEVELTVKQAKALHGLLDEMYGEKMLNFPSPPIVIRESRPYWDYFQPVWTCSQGMDVKYASETGSMCCDFSKVG